MASRPRLSREQRQRRLIRRRRWAAVLIVALAAAVIAVVLTAVTQRGSAAHDASATGASAPGAARRGRARSVHRAAVTSPQGASGGARASGRPGTEAVPVLTYHVINPPPAGAPFPGLYVPRAEFAAQMLALQRAGWHAVTLDQVLAYWRHGVPLPAGRPIVITFDNGYQSQYANALPVLRALHWVADLNLQLSGLPPSQGGLSRREVRALVSAGWELDTQGFSHADLITLDADSLHYQIAIARSVVRARYHVAANWFCYPSGHYDATVIAAVKAAGYVGSTTTIPGWAAPDQDPYRLERIRVLEGTTAPSLLALISGLRDSDPPPPSYSGG